MPITHLSKRFLENKPCSSETARLADGPAPTQASSNLFNTRIIYGKTENKGFIGAFGVNYNITEGVVNGLVRQATYDFNCFGIDIGYNRFNLGPLRDENQLRIATSFSNVSAFSNLRTRDRLYH